VRWVTVEDGRPAGKVFRKFADCIERGMYNLMWRRDSRDVWVEGDILGGIRGFRKKAYSYKTKDCPSCNVSHNNILVYIEQRKNLYLYFELLSQCRQTR